MFNNEFFQEQFALTELQARDYTKAYNRIHSLLKEIDPLKRARRYRYYHYEDEALEVLSSLEGINSLADAMALLKNFFYKFAKSGKQQVADAAREILSIRDNYMWPKEIYDDWKENGKQDGKVKFSPAFVHSCI